jgi:small subunit ribosomal protein S16
VSVRIRLKRFGTKRKPFYRVVVMDSHAPRDGRVLEEIGFYHPAEKTEKQVSLRVDRVREWMQKGAQPSAVVRRLLNRVEKAKQA